jgi:hypothetical protein
VVELGRKAVHFKSNFLVHLLRVEAEESPVWSHQLLDGKLAGTNKAKAASKSVSSTLGMSLARLPFCKGTVVPLDRFLTHKNLQMNSCSVGSFSEFLNTQKMGPQETTCKKKVVVQASMHTVGSISSTDASQ